MPVVYTRPNQKPISAPLSISRCGSRAHPHCYPQFKKTSSPHGPDSPNNSSKNSFKSPKQQQKATFGNPTKVSSQLSPKNKTKRRAKIQLAHTVFFFKQQIFQDKFTSIKPANSLSHPAVDSDTSWSPTTTTAPQSMLNPCITTLAQSF